MEVGLLVEGLLVVDCSFDFNMIMPSVTKEKKKHFNLWIFSGTLQTT